VISQLNLAHVKANISYITIADTLITYNRTDEEVEATFLSNSTSSNYQLYNAMWVQEHSISKSWFVDGVATREDGEEIVDPGWIVDDFHPPIGCADVISTISSTSYAVRTGRRIGGLGGPLLSRLFWTGLVTIIMAGW
jgi:hypothetical protein